MALDFENLKTLKWPPAPGELDDESFTDREVKGQPSTERGRRIRERLLNAKMTLDPEFTILYTKAWRKYEGEPLFIRRALSYKEALEGLTPVINPDELIVMQKTRYMRGAPAYLQYSARYYPDMLEYAKKGIEETSDIYDVASGGGRSATKREGFLNVGAYALAVEDVEPFEEAVNYWLGKNIEDVSFRYLEQCMPEYEDLMNGFEVVLWPQSVVSIMEGRWVPAYDLVVYKGLQAIIDECEEKIKNTIATDWESNQKVLFWKASAIACQGVINWARNYAKKAREMAETEPDAQRKKELLEIAEILEWVPAKPARTFREGLQAAWIAHIAVAMDGPIVGLSPGRWGQLLEPLYQADLKAGRITPEQALELLELIRVKFSSEEYISPRAWQSVAQNNLFQHWIVGGLDRDGNPAEGDLDILTLQAGINMPTVQPTLGILVDPKTSEKLILKAAECTKAGNGYPAWFNNQMIINHMLMNHRDENITLEDARDVAMGGCVESQMQGTCHGICHPAFFNEVKVLEIVLNDGVDPRTGKRVYPSLGPIDSWEKLWDAWCKVEEKFARVYVRYWNYVYHVKREINPLIFGSVLVKDCVEKGRPLEYGGARYNRTVTLLNSGMVNVANSLAAIKKLVFEEKKYTMDQLREALANNWGFERGDKKGIFSMLQQKRIDPKWAKMHRDFLDAPKFGNDDDYVDQIFVDLWHHYNSTLYQETTYLGHSWIPAALSISAHGPFGRVCGATPDGRLAGVTLTDGILSATPGTDVNGPIALMASGVKLDPTPMRSVQLNMKLHPNAVKGPEGTRNLANLITSYMNRGGYHVQFNIVDSNMLRDAQKHPERYRDLLVRVAGFSAYWVELAKPIQDELIARTEYNAI